jgi:hypothetical protein
MPAIELNKEREIVINLQWLLESLTSEQKREIADSLSCMDDIIEDVAAQILDGWTERLSGGARSFSAEASTPLDRARRKLAEGANEVAKEEIADLKNALIRAKAMEEHYQDAYLRAYHAWNDRDHRACPSWGPLPVGTNHIYEVVRRDEQ